MRKWTHRAAALGGAVLVTVTAACGSSDDAGDGGGDGAEAADTEAGSALAQLVNNTELLEQELNNAENRIVQACLEDQGLLVHDNWALFEYDVESEGGDSFFEYDPFQDWLPELESAQQWGFGAWAEAPEARDSDEAEAYFEHRLDEAGSDEGNGVDNSAFDALSNDEKRAWYVAYGGEEFAEAHYSANFLTESELRELVESTGAEGGSLGLGNPEPGGCLMEMIEAVYGEPNLVEEEFDGGSEEKWVWRPQAPINAELIDLPDWSAEIVDEQDAMITCLSDRGHRGWVFDRDRGELPVTPYWSSIYLGDSEMEAEEGGSVEVPDPPADLPSDFEGRKAAEITMAVDFVECADSSGYRENYLAELDAAYAEVYGEVETELYAWQEGIEEALDKTQELIGA